MASWVAVGGRGTLIGPLLGAAALSGLKSWLTAAFPELWLYALGLLFIVVTRYLPQGLAGAASGIRLRWPQLRAQAPLPDPKVQQR
jgi:urea transport system permease protein